MSPRPCRGGDRGGVSDIKEGDRGTWKILVWAKTLTPPLPLPYRGGESIARGQIVYNHLKIL